MFCAMLIFISGQESELESVSDQLCRQSSSHCQTVGRTGSGKTSLILSLLGNLDVKGDIFYDGISAKEVNLSSLRSKISLIPQSVSQGGQLSYILLTKPCVARTSNWCLGIRILLSQVLIHHRHHSRQLGSLRRT